jgi:dTDP-4-amino-4,6-dideoxygalactose transaminase
MSSRKDWVERARFLSTQARLPAPHYEHDEVGYNYRMSNLLAAVGRGQLRVLEARVARRREIFEAYRRDLGDLPGWSFMPEAHYGRSNRWLTCVLIDPALGPSREEIRQMLESENIEARPVWKPMHLQLAFAQAAVFGGATSEQLFDGGLCLPSGSSLSEEDRTRVVALIRKRVSS